VRLWHRQDGFLAANMQPDVVAHSLVKVEDEWRAHASDFAECNVTAPATQCGDAQNAFEKSCSTVVSAIVQASTGDKNRVEEYMNIVCSREELTGWHQQRCTELASAVSTAMVYDLPGNREYLQPSTVCTSFWSRFSVQEKDRVEKERAEAAKEAEIRAQKEEAERAEREKKAVEEAAEAKRRHEKELEEAKKAEEKRQAEEAAKQLAAQKAEAERQAEEAKHKLEEAQAVAEEAIRRHKEAAEKAAAAANASAHALQHLNATQHNASVHVHNATGVASNMSNISTTVGNSTITQNVTR